MNKLTKAVRKEIKKKLKRYGGSWIAIHKNTAKHILQITDKRRKNV